MKKIDIIFAIICGLGVAWIGLDFFKKFGWIFFIALPILSVFGLWTAELIGKKFKFIHQAAKFALAGGFADMVDIKVFQFLFWLAPFSLTFKAVSFLAGTFVKFYSDKHWTFEKHEKDGIKKEMLMFFAVAIAGMALNVGSFYFFTKIMGPQFSMSDNMWRELCIIFAALVTATWNFLGYKLLVFKK